MYALVHGFKLGFNKPFKDKDKKTDIFKWSNFKDEDIVLIRSICLLHRVNKGNDDPNIINSKSEMVRIIEIYANGGLQDLLSKIDMPDFETNVVDLLANEFEK